MSSCWVSIKYQRDWVMLVKKDNVKRSLHNSLCPLFPFLELDGFALSLNAVFMGGWNFQIGF